MVQSKPKKRKKAGSVVDFKRVKRRVGRRVQPSQNQTDTAFKAKRVFLKEQAVSPSGQSLTQLLPLLNHHNDAARLSALEHLLAFVSPETPLPNAVYPALIEKLMPLLVDPHKPVRIAVADVTCALLKQGDLEQMAHERKASLEASQPFFPFVKLFMLHVCSALSSIHFATRLDALTFVDMMNVYFPHTLCKEFRSVLVHSLNALLCYCLDNPIGKTAYTPGNPRAKRGKAKKTQIKMKIPAIYRVTRSLLRFTRLIQEDLGDVDVGSNNWGGSGSLYGGIAVGEPVSFRRMSPSVSSGAGKGGEDNSEDGKGGSTADVDVDVDVYVVVKTVANVWEHSVARMERNDGQRLGDRGLLQHLKDVAELGWVCMMITASREESLGLLQKMLGCFPMAQGRISDKASKPRIELNGQLSLLALMVKKTRSKAVEWLTSAINASGGIHAWAVEALKQGFSLGDEGIDLVLAKAVGCKCVALVEDERTEDLVRLIEILTQCLHVEEVAHVLPNIPKTLWKLFDGDHPQNVEAHIVLSFAQRLLRRSASCDLFSKRFVSMLYATRKQHDGGVMGPFVTKMSHKNQLLTLHVAAQMGPLSDNFLKALAVNLWMAPKETPLDVLQAIIDLPFISACTPAQQLSFAITVCLSKTTAELDALVINRTSEEATVAMNQTRHALITERVVQHLSNLAASGVAVLPSLAPLIREKVLHISCGKESSMCMHIGSVVKLAKAEEIVQRRLDAIGLLCAYLRRVIGDEEIVTTLGQNSAILTVALYVSSPMKEYDENHVVISPLHQSVLEVLVKLTEDESTEGIAIFTQALCGWCSLLEGSEVKLSGKKESDMVNSLVEYVQGKCNSSGKAYIALAGRLEARFSQ